MIDNALFLRQLSRFNNVCRHREAGDTTTRNRVAACVDAERELCAAIYDGANAPGLMRVLAERIARAEAETQVGVLIAHNADFAKVWRDAGVVSPEPLDRLPRLASVLRNRFFSVTHVCDNSYRFFTVSAGH